MGNQSKSRLLGFDDHNRRPPFRESAPQIQPGGEFRRGSGRRDSSEASNERARAVSLGIPKQKISNCFGGRMAYLLPCCLILLLLVLSVQIESGAESGRAPGLDRSTIDQLPAKIDLSEGRDVRFRQLSSGADLSQTRVGWMVQDRVGFIWFGTQYGLNRFDGYESKVFKHEPGNPGSLSCVYIRSLFVDHAGTLWVGCDSFLDRFEPVTETFAHYRIDTGTSIQLSTPIERISEDAAGVLFLVTERGLYRFNPASAGTIGIVYAPHDLTSIAENRINQAGEDREGRFWVAGAGGLEELDRNAGRVIRRAPLHAEIGRFHEDESGVFWMTERDPGCGLATWNPRTNVVKCHSLQYKMRAGLSKVEISEILEDRSGTIWFGSGAGLLKFDRVHNRILRYHNDPFDSESLKSDRIIHLYQDQEGNIWTCFQDAEPDFFSERAAPFENFTYPRGSLLDPLVTSIYEDHNGILWIGSMGGLNRVDRHSGKNIALPNPGNEMLAIVEDRQGVLFGGTYHEGLRRINRETGKLSQYSSLSANHPTDPIMRLIYDHEGNLWAAQYGGVGRYDPAAGKFTMYTPDTQDSVQYQEIKIDGRGFLWLGSQTGLHRFNPRTAQFKLYEHHPEDSKSLSDNRVNSIHIDRQGRFWVGTQNGLDRLDPASDTFQNYFEKDGLSGDVVSCIQEDKQGVLWMSTNKGLSSFDPQLQRFRNFSVADGLPGRDLTGWGACYQSSSGEMFFGGFSGATAFYPSHLADSSFVPRTVLTDFRLSGNPVPIGAGSPLAQSITRTDSINLSHQQKIFSIAFSALSFFNASTNRYRYKLDGLDHDWHEVGGDQRTASYTTLPAGSYTFEVQGATSRGPWSEPARLRIKISPDWYQMLWFRGICAIAFLAILWLLYLFRLAELKREFNAALDARVRERTRIARELHDTLLQSFQGAVFQFQAARKLALRNADNAMQVVDEAIQAAEEGIREGRAAIQDLRPDPATQRSLSELLSAAGHELASAQGQNGLAPGYRVVVEGKQQDLSPLLQDEVYRISREVIRNAFAHAAASLIEVEIRYDQYQLRLRVRDDGKGIDPKVLAGGQQGHFGIPGMRERAQRIGARLDFWSEMGAGTEVELTVPASMAYQKRRDGRRFRLFRWAGRDGQGS
jgi:signal transduction histidine kinase/ligand-binding sensor domain-containing protein